MYPKYGPGQMWEQTAKLVLEKGAQIHLHYKVIGGVDHNGAEGVVFDLMYEESPSFTLVM